MKIYGYSDDESDQQIELREATISACPNELREISDFFLKCADEIEKYKDDWDHEHFKEDDEPQFIIANPSDC